MPPTLDFVEVYPAKKSVCFFHLIMASIYGLHWLFLFSSSSRTSTFFQSPLVSRQCGCIPLLMQQTLAVPLLKALQKEGQGANYIEACSTLANTSGPSFSYLAAWRFDCCLHHCSPCSTETTTAQLNHVWNQINRPYPPVTARNFVIVSLQFH